MTLLDETLLEDRRPGTDLADPADDAGLAELQLGNVRDRGGAPLAISADEDEPAPTETLDGRTPVNPLSASLAAFLSAAAVGWAFGGIFEALLPRLLGILGAAIGAGVIALARRMRKPLLLQVLALPLAIATGVGLLAPYLSGTSPWQLVADAIKAGGLSQPPVPFDPGWRFVIVVLCAAVAITAVTSAVAFDRSRLAAFIPAPLVAAAAVLQPPGKELVSVAPALALIVASLAIAFGAELSRDAETGARFEVRRLGRAAGFVVVIVAAVFGLSQLGFLYPPTSNSNIIPPKRPQTPPPITNNDVLFTVTQSENTPLRLGVLDVYSGTAWLTPPYDPRRYLPVHSGQRVPAFAPDRSTPDWNVAQPPPTVATVTSTITVVKPDPSRELPDITGMVSETGAPKGTTFDPRSQTLRLPTESRNGETYTITALPAPSGGVLSQEPASSAAEIRQFLSVPTPPPPAVETILDAVPPGDSPFARLQYVRAAFFNKITASGAGDPVDVPPARVQAFLTGTLASPYEITASEVLMARWAGIPARIGYGYYDQDAAADGTTPVSIRPDDGALWLEAYFPQTGWTPILGHPAKAQASLNEAKDKTPQIRPNGLIAAQVLVPIRLENLTLFYRLAQFYVLRALEFGVPIALLLFVLPGVLKMWRRSRRRRWALQRGARERIAVAYAEIRDRCIDMNVGHPTLTPLEFLDVLAPDPEHTGLAWLVTRALWGDLRRDLRDVDVEAAEALSRSVFKRLNAAQPFLTRIIAFGSRVSLRDPWETAMPNAYWKRGPVRAVGAALGRVRHSLRERPGRMRKVLGGTSAVILLIVLVLFTAGCQQQLNLTSTAHAPLPPIPAAVGSYQFNPDPLAQSQFDQLRKVALIADYDFYAIRQDNVVVGTLQTAAFKAGLKADNRAVRAGVLSSLGGSSQISKVANQIFYTENINALTYVVWFPPDGLTYQLLAATQSIVDPTALFAQLITVEQGGSVTSAQIERGAPPVDSRRSAS